MVWETVIHPGLHCITHSHLEAQIKPLCMFLVCRRKPEHVETTNEGLPGFYSQSAVSEHHAGPQKEALSTFPWMQHSQVHYYHLISYDITPPSPSFPHMFLPTRQIILGDDSGFCMVDCWWWLKLVQNFINYYICMLTQSFI